MAVSDAADAEMSLPPWVVPTTAVSPDGNTGVMVTLVAPYGGFWVDAVRLALFAGSTVATVLADLVGSSAEVALMVTGPDAAGAVQAPVAGFMVPAPALQVTVPRKPPVTPATVKARAPPAPTVGAAGATAPTTTVWGVTATLASTWSPAPFVARSQ